MGRVCNSAHSLNLLFQCSLGFVSFYAKPFCFQSFFTSSKTAAWPFTSPLRWCRSGLECGPLHNPSQGPFSIFVPGYASQWGIFCGDSLTSVGLLMYSHWARHGWLLRLIPGTFILFFKVMYSNTGTRNYENICIWLETLDKAEFGHQVCRMTAVSVLSVLLGLKSRWLVKVGPWLLRFFQVWCACYSFKMQHNCISWDARHSAG